MNTRDRMTGKRHGTHAAARAAAPATQRWPPVRPGRCPIRRALVIPHFEHRLPELLAWQSPTAGIVRKRLRLGGDLIELQPRAR
jgi:hypothetical protein